MKMKVVPSLIATLIFLLSLSIVEASLEDTCKQVVQNGVGFDYNFCITTLQVAPGSHSADQYGLVLIATNLAKTNMTHNLDKVKELLNSKNVPQESKKYLEDCKDSYDSSVDELTEALGYIKSHDKGSALIYLTSVLTDVDACTYGWAKSKQKSPMAKEDDDAVKISSLALAIGSLLP